MNALHPDDDKHWVLLPTIARKQYLVLINKQDNIKKIAEESLFNRLEELDGKGTGIITCGIGYNYVKECEPKGVSAILKISQYPLPEKQIKKLAAMSDNILIVEDGQPFVEEQVKAILGPDYPIAGRLTGNLPRTGELNPDNVAKALGKEFETAYKDVHDVVGRPPALCQGCGHRDVYKALNEVAAEYPDARIFGDIGCYTLGALPPFQSIASCVDMGASITMAKGAADGGLYPAIAIIGDSTFTHSGMTGLLDAVNENANITIVISDNLTTAMTGGQDSAGTNKFEAICVGLGVPKEHVRVVVPLQKNMPEITKILREEINYKGVSVIIPRRECMQTLGRKLRKAKVQQK
jgi:indolepyruvate ferredoxin oxidoreductase alpha subunit